MIEQCFGNVKDIKHYERKYKDMRVYGFDTETPNYRIKLLSISNGVDSEVFDVTEETILDVFLEYFEKVPENEIVIFAHNLSFDFLVLLNQDLKFPSPQFLKKECRWNYGDVVIVYFNEPPYFAEIYIGKKILHLRDTFSFFGRIQLSKLSESLKIGHKIKIDKTDFYQEGIETNRQFREYAKEDARLTALIGDRIMEFHAMENSRLCVSGPQLSMNVFRNKFLPRNKCLKAPPRELMRFFEFSYHGGKNGCYRPTPIEIRKANLMDINSAYPFSMTRIPSFIDCEYKTVMHKNGNGDYRTPGIVLVDLESSCPFNSTFTHSFVSMKKLENVWITSYELDSLIGHGCLKKLRIRGYIQVIQKLEYNPLARYAETFYKLKNEQKKDSPLYLYYKVCMLNALYGKFIERRYDEEHGYAIRGPNYNPAIASLITGYTRAYMHEMEHESDAIHSATDAVFCTGKLKTGKDLGELSNQGTGKLCLMRTKLYLFYQGDKLVKQARHGFHGTEEQLIEVWNKHLTKYTYVKIPTAGEYLLHKNLHLKLFGMNEYTAKINIDWTNMSVV